MKRIAVEVTEQFPLLEIVDEKLYPILDTMIDHAQRKGLYTPELSFFIRQDRPDSNFVIAIDINHQKVGDYYGLFLYKGHKFTFQPLKMEDSFVVKTDQTTEYDMVYTINVPLADDEPWTFYLFEEWDLLVSMRVFRYENGEFILEPKANWEYW